MTKPSGKRIALNKLSLTKRTVEALKPAAKSWIAWDDTLTGFGDALMFVKHSMGR